MGQRNQRNNRSRSNARNCCMSPTPLYYDVHTDDIALILGRASLYFSTDCSITDAYDCGRDSTKELLLTATISSCFLRFCGCWSRWASDCCTRDVPSCAHLANIIASDWLEVGCARFQCNCTGLSLGLMRVRQSPRAIRSSCVRLRRNDLLFILSYVTLHPTTLSLPSLVVFHTPCRASSSLARKNFNFVMNALWSHAWYCKNNTIFVQTICTNACVNCS